MMQEWRERLLEAEPDELRGIGDTEVARRIRQDAELRAAASTILEQQNALHHALTRLAGEHTPHPEHANAENGEDANAAGRGAHVHAMGARRVRSRRARSVAAASLAAAALFTLLLTRPGARVPVTPAAPPTPLTAQLDAASDRPFAVIATDNPDIAIVWLFNKED